MKAKQQKAKEKADAYWKEKREADKKELQQLREEKRQRGLVGLSVGNSQPSPAVTTPSKSSSSTTSSTLSNDNDA